MNVFQLCCVIDTFPVPNSVEKIVLDLYLLIQITYNYW